MRAKEGNDKRFYFYHFELNPMNPPSVLRRFTGCGAGVEYVAVNPKGDIFPCHQFDNVLSYKMGNVGQAAVQPRPDFVKAHALNKNIVKNAGQELCAVVVAMQIAFHHGEHMGPEPPKL